MSGQPAEIVYIRTNVASLYKWHAFKTGAGRFKRIYSEFD